MRKTCRWCKSHCIPDTDHFVWQYPRESRPSGKPILMMQCKFGWPDPCENQAYNEKVVYHTVQVRAMMLAAN